MCRQQCNHPVCFPDQPFHGTWNLRLRIECSISFFAQGFGVFIVLEAPLIIPAAWEVLEESFLWKLSSDRLRSPAVLLTSSFSVAVDVYPFYIVARSLKVQVNCHPRYPISHDTWNQFTLWVSFQQESAVYQVAQAFSPSLWRVQNAEGFQLTEMQ